MAPMDRCLVSMAGLGLRQLSQAVRPSPASIPRFLAPALVQTRHATGSGRPSAASRSKSKKKKPPPKDFKRHNLEKREFPQFSLCEAMRILRAVEVGEPAMSVKYEVHINLKASRNGPVIRSSVRLPHPVTGDWDIAVICREGSEAAKAAVAAGAVAVGEESIFESIRQGKMDFDRLICHDASEQALNKAGLGKILGPKGLMPSKRMRTIVSDVAKTIGDYAGAADYRERQGTIHMAIGQLSHTPDQLKANMQTLMKKIRTECADMSEEVPKEVHEVILSTTHGPSLSLNGKFRDFANEHVSPEALSSVM